MAIVNLAHAKSPTSQTYANKNLAVIIHITPYTYKADILLAIVNALKNQCHFQNNQYLFWLFLGVNTPSNQYLD